MEPGAADPAAPVSDQDRDLESGAEAPHREAGETFSAREESFSAPAAPDRGPEDAPRDFEDRDQSPDPEGYETEPVERPEEPAESRPEPPREERRDFRPAAPAAVTEAIDEVNRIIVALRTSLDTMDEILETLELAEVQKTADEREIQSLRNALRGFDRPSSAEPRRDAREPRDPNAPREPRRGDDRRRGGRR